MKQHVILLSLLCLSLPLAAQTTSNQKKSVSQEIEQIEKKTMVGTVLDENQEPLPGATIRLEGTQTGTVTDAEGNFSILVSGRRPTLIISYVGMETVNLELAPNVKFAKVVMKPMVTLMSEVVVTGYQNLKRENATGAYQQISSEDMDKRFTGNITANLEGKIAGLVMNPTKSGEEALTIRGVSSFNAKTSPLIVVDGLPIEGGLETVNPYEVENITVLKDAAAAAIYGARASNGVIVITTKRAQKERLTVDFNADLIISEKQKYDNFNWASAAEIIQLEKYNFDAIKKANSTVMDGMVNDFEGGRIYSYSPVMRLMMQNYMGQLNDADLNATLNQWSRNDYRKEWQKIHDRTQIDQQYNLALRVQGKTLSSSIVANYSYGNRGVQKEHDSALNFKYDGELKVAPWMNLNFGVNLINSRSRSHASSTYSDMNSYMAYESMYNADGSLARMEGDVWLGEEALGDATYGLKDHSFNMAEEMNRNFTNYRYTNIRSHVDALFKLPVEGWTVQTQFQYEDINARSRTLYEADSYHMRNIYNLYTTAESVQEWVDDPNFDWFDPNIDWFDPHLGQMQITNTKVYHAIPDGGLLSTYHALNRFYTFRAQTHYAHEFGRHAVDALAGLEYRETHSTSDNDLRYGYDHDTQTNLNVMTDWAFLNNPTTGVLGADYPVYGASTNFDTTDVLHRYFSWYFTANYVYDKRYSLSASYRVDKTDLFGTDPKFRSRPLWSVGASWNMHNEAFMKQVSFVDALKLRVSYGLTGNIDSSATSYLTAKLSNNSLNGNLMGSLQTPPNDQLRWEKTSTWNVGADFALFGYRLNGSLDYYHKSGSDLLTLTDLDITTGWSSLTINNGEMTNTGIELQLDGRILPAKRRSDIGVNLGFNIAWNKNKVTKVLHEAKSGSEYMGMQLHEGYPLNSIFSIDYAGIVEKDGTYYVGWKDKEGQVHTESVGSATFTIDDCVYSGSSTPTVTGALMPEITWHGFSLSAMFNFYGGHYMRVGNEAWSSNIGGLNGYRSTFGQGAVSRDLLRYWQGDKDVPANGYAAINYSNMNYGRYRHTNVVHADYIKLRNLVLGYTFDKKLCRRIGLDNLRLRVQMNNICTWAANSQGIDPEAMNVLTGTPTYATPRSYTMSLSFNL